MKEKQYLIVLDSFEYKAKESEFYSYLRDIINPHFFYSKYENRITEQFQKTPIIGGMITHIAYWMLSLGYAIKLFNKKYAEINNIISQAETLYLSGDFKSAYEMSEQALAKLNFRDKQ